MVSPNMSVGVNVIFDLAAQMAKMLGNDYDIEILETHHRFKKDSPSGTALRIAEKICETTNKQFDKDVIYGRHGITGERPTNQICMHAIRSGDVIGEHTVVFGSLGERIEITHKAHTRDTFVRGAIRAAKFIAQKQPGMYCMSDVLKCNHKLTLQQIFLLMPHNHKNAPCISDYFKSLNSKNKAMRFDKFTIKDKRLCRKHRN